MVRGKAGSGARQDQGQDWGLPWSVARLGTAMVRGQAGSVARLGTAMVRGKAGSGARQGPGRVRGKTGDCHGQGQDRVRGQAVSFRGRPDRVRQGPGRIDVLYNKEFLTIAREQPARSSGIHCLICLRIRSRTVK